MWDPRKTQYLPIWHKIFLLCCVVAASLDPLFFYIPVIKPEQICLKMDEKLKNTMLTLRSVMDLTYIFHSAFHIFCGYIACASQVGWSLPRRKKFGMICRAKWWIVLIDFLCVLPLPQVLILENFEKMKGPKAVNTRKLLNFLILVQFVPRIFRIFLSCKELTRNLSSREIVGAAWVKGLFNFILYIIASHLVGAVWYFFSVQRALACWQNACKTNEKCRQSTFVCADEIVNYPIIDYLNASCPLDLPSVFDFGMFAPALNSKIVNSMDFPRKFFYSFAWGLRNLGCNYIYLSSFGSNLIPSANFWETFFSAGISVIGLLLFIYLIGNLQTYLQLSAQDSQKKMKKMKIKEVDIDTWINNNGIPKDMRSEIMDRVRRKMLAREDVDLKNLLKILPTRSKRRIKQTLCLPILKEVRQLQQMDERSIDEIINEHSEIFREGDPLNQMLFFTQGTACSYSSSPTNPNELQKGDFYGEELIDWALGPPSSPFPISNANVRTHTKVESFALESGDMKKVVSSWNLRERSRLNSTNSRKSRWSRA